MIGRLSVVARTVPVDVALVIEGILMDLSSLVVITSVP